MGAWRSFPFLEGKFLIFPLFRDTMVWTALLVVLTVSFVAAKKEVIKVPIALRGNILTGSVFIGNQEYDMSLGTTSDDTWVFDKELKGQIKDSPEFTRHFYMKRGSFQRNSENPYFESAVFDTAQRKQKFTISGQNVFEDIRFQKDPKDNFFKAIPMGIVTKLESPLNSNGFDYDGRFGLWPWKDDTPDCPMLAWGDILDSYTESCMSLFGDGSKTSYLDNLPQKKYSIYLSDSGSGELMLGGYDESKIEGKVRCTSIERFRGSGSDVDWYHTYLSLSTPFFHGKKRLNAGRKGPPIRRAIIDIEVRGLQVPLPTLRNIVKQTGAKKKSVMPSISEEDEQHNTAHEGDRGYFISCNRRSKVDEIRFSMDGGFLEEEKNVSLTGYDLFIPSKVNPSWCKMVISPLPPPLARSALIVLGDIFFKKYVTILDFKAGRGRTSLCVGTAKQQAAKHAKEEGGGGGTKTGGTRDRKKVSRVFSATNTTMRRYPDHDLSG